MTGTVTVEATTSNRHQTDEFKLHLSPNPTDGNVRLKLSGIAPDNLSIALYSLDAQLVLEENISGSDMQLNIQNLTAGWYVYALRNANNVLEHGKLLVEK